jgi:hypothetical protein
MPRTLAVLVPPRDSPDTHLPSLVRARPARGLAVTSPDHVEDCRPSLRQRRGEANGDGRAVPNLCATHPIVTSQRTALESS